MDIFHLSFLRNYLIKDYEIFDNFVFSLKVLLPLKATAGGMWALLTSCYILLYSTSGDNDFCKVRKRAKIRNQYN